MSDEWLLDKQAFRRVERRWAEFGGQVLATLTNRVDVGAVDDDGRDECAAGGGVSAGADGELVGECGSAAAATYSAYRALDGAVTLQSAGAVTHALSDGDGTLQIAALKTAAVKELANDVTVSGEMEPTAYVTERFAGDGTTTEFQLTEAPFRPKAAGKSSQLISDSFDRGRVQYAGLECNRSGLTFGIRCGGADDDGRQWVRWADDADGDRRGGDGRNAGGRGGQPGAGYGERWGLSAGCTRARLRVRIALRDTTCGRVAGRRWWCRS